MDLVNLLFKVVSLLHRPTRSVNVVGFLEGQRADQEKLFGTAQSGMWRGVTTSH